MPKLFDIEKFNKILKDYKQSLYAVFINGQKVILSNGLELKEKTEIERCKKRVMRGHAVWKEHFDRLYSLTPAIRNNAEKFCRSATSKQGGISCQQLHGERIIQKNLNSRDPWSKGLKGNYPYSYPCSEETKKKISEANKGEKNGMYGRRMSEKEKQRKSRLMKEKILAGEFTPNSNNRNTHWDSYYKNKKYRSSWEALYHFFDAAAEYETIRIPYEYNNLEHIYIVDFVNHQTKTLIEVKPEEMLNDKRTQAKIAAAKEWCLENNYNLLVADKNYFISKPRPNTLKDFDIHTQNKIRKLYETC